MWGLFSSFDYAKEWKAVDEQLNTNPKTALSKVNSIEKQAKAEGNAPQQIRCIIERAKAKNYIEEGAFTKCLEEMKQFQQQTKDDVARSVATYMIGKLYLKYYHDDAYAINRRTNLGNYVPEDIMEWTSNIFIDKIREYSFAALSNEKLKAVPATEYEALLQKGEDSRVYRPTLYDLFLTDLLWGEDSYSYDETKIISSEEKEKLLRERAAFHANDKERDAYVQSKLSLMDFLYEGKKDRAPLVSEMEAFLEETKKERASILVRIALCEELKRSACVPLYDLPQDSKLPQRLMDICDGGIKDFPKHNKINELKAFAEELNRPSVSISVENTKVYTSDKVRLKIRYANLERVKLNLFRLDVSSSFDYKSLNRDEIKKDKKFQTQSFSYDLPKTNYCVLRDTIVELPALDFGMYRVELGSIPQHYMDFEVSNLFYLQTRRRQKEEDIISDYVVVDAKSGAPKQNVNLTVKKKRNNGEPEILAETSTDPSGFSEIILPGKGGYVSTCFADGNDRFLSPDTYSLYRYSYNGGARTNDNAGTYVSIFTDRGIYRPSQTVYYKAILYKLERKAVEVIANKALKVIVYDANGQTITEQKLKTNEFGSIASSFVIPASGLSGDFRIYVESYGSELIRVEEYKRPTFEVKMTRPTNAFSFGDSITVKGRADYLLGTPLSGAKVEYTVARAYSWWWPSPSLGDDNTVAEGTCVVADDGSFDIPFVARKNEADEGLAYYRYSVSAKVTDANGETHEETIFLSVGDRSLIFSSDSQKRMLMDDFPAKRYKIANLNGEGQVVNVSYEVLRDSTSVATGSVLSDKEGAFTLNVDTKKWLSGAYKVNLKTLDEKGREVTASYEMVLYRKNDKRPAVHTVLWTEDVKDLSLPYGKEYKVRVGSSLKDAHLLVVVNDEQGEVERRWVDLNDEIKDFSFKLEEKNGENLNVRFFLVNEGTCHESSFSIRKQQESKWIPIKLSVFRNKMLPGSKETWTLTLPKERQAEVMAAMYDASLDQFCENEWSFIPVYRRIFQFPSWAKCHWINASLSYSWMSFIEPTDWIYDRFIALPDGYRRYIYDSFGAGAKCEDGMAAPMMMKSAMASNAMYDSADNAGIEQEEELVEVADDGGSPEHEPEPESESPALGNNDAPAPQVRKNFAETAFFYPQLRTDKEGNVQFSFEMLESLTRWNFKALAHTKDLFFGQMSEQMVTQKDFMISPNLPRFLRKGDRCVLSAKVINLSESTIKGTALMELLDPVTEKVVAKLNAQFSVEAGKNTAVTWTFDVPRDRDAVLVRTSAVAGNFSDAEQTLLPILSDRMVVTQSLPLYVRGGQTKNYTFDNLVNNQSTTLSSRFLKLEFAKDPIWYAVQALPSVASVEHENAVSYSAAHFASLMSEHIAKSNPKIFNVINMWKSQGMDKQTLLSNLEKNQDVKNVLLNESPWVMEAKDETEMKQRLSTLFDMNDLHGKCSLWFDKLMEFRLKSGAYTWFKCVEPYIYPSTHTTLFVLDNFGRLRKAGIVDDAFLQRAQYRSSLQFLDGELRDAYEELKRFHPKDYKEVAYVGMNELYYFQVHSLFPEVKVDAKAKEAFTFYYELAKKRWKDFSLYGRALAAIAFYRGGDKELAKTIVESIREFSTTTDEMGMFWLKNESGYLWHQAPISAHTRLMEALEVVDPKVQEQDEMRLWLLNQKRTQNWDNTIANVDALSVLLLSGSDWLSNDNQVTIKLGGETVQPEKTEAGTGYFTHYINGDDVKPSMGHVELKSEAGGNISWGALYWQFEEDIDKVWKNKTALHVEKMVMLEVRENGKSVLKQINEGTKLSVGDRLVVRLTLRTDRDMDYVSLKDQRASCLEPTQQLSGYRCSEGTCYYQSPKDAAMYYFFDHLAKGTYVFEYPLWVTHAGDYSNGITSAQCLYAPEFLTNTGSVRIRVEEGK
jgi:hypothetical protein